MALQKQLYQQFEDISWLDRIKRRELIRSAYLLSNLADKIQYSEDFTTRTPKKLASLIYEISKILTKSIPNAKKEYLDAIYFFLKETSKHLRYVERAKISQTPWSIIPIAESFFKSVVGENSHFIIRPIWEYNYSIIHGFKSSYFEQLKSWTWFDFSELEKALKENKLIESDDSIFCISFPRLEKQNCLLHANWGHEIGHIIIRDWLENDFNNLWKKAEPKIRGNIESDIKSKSPKKTNAFEIFLEVSEGVKNTYCLAQSGFSELLCDCIGVHLFGVSALSAIIEFSSKLKLDVSPLESNFYPPWRFRLRKMFKYCENDLKQIKRKKIDKKIDVYLKWLFEAKKLTSSKSDKDIIQSDIQCNEAYNFIELNWSHALNKTIKSLPIKYLKPYKISDNYLNLMILSKRLENNIPPNEIRNNSKLPASLPDIICCAWIYKIYKIQSDPKWENKEDLDMLHRLVLKAAECSYVHSELGRKLKK